MSGHRGTHRRFVPQRTLKNSIYCSGIGLHCGRKVNLTLHPADPDTGIVFRRSDLRGGAWEVPARWDNAVETPLCATLAGPDGERITTIEHLMSALAGCGIDNVIAELNGPEVPIMDGSAAPFVFLLECAGAVNQNAPRRVVEVIKEVAVVDAERTISVAPARRLSITFEIEYDTPLIARQEWTVDVTQSVYKREIARARTFGFLHEVDQLRRMGLARGGSLDNAVVINGESVLNEGGLRYHNEFVRHKVLDLVGDLYLAGGPLLAAVRGIRTGHALTLRLLRALFADPEAW
ncbi:MAG: UDP-3-O-acyl-N-acetylglucosamine deacetylase, partial [Alphaproteobacteria bacterium]